MTMILWGDTLTIIASWGYPHDHEHEYNLMGIYLHNSDRIWGYPQDHDLSLCGYFHEYDLSEISSSQLPSEETLKTMTHDLRF